MGQKTHPYGIRLGIIKSWKSRWFAAKNFTNLLHEDILIRRYTRKRLEHAGVADIEILRAPKKVTIDIHTAKRIPLTTRSENKKNAVHRITVIDTFPMRTERMVGLVNRQQWLYFFPERIRD